MKNKVHKKIAFDAVLAFTWIALMLYALTGSFLHEWVGLISFALILIHLAVNANWIVQTTKRFRASAFTKTKYKYILNIGLLFLTLFTGISGILISTEIFPWINVGDRPVLVFLHHLSAYVTMILISVHIGLHGEMILAVCRKWFHIEKPSILRNFVCKMLALGVVTWGLGAQLFYEITLPSGSSSTETTKKEETTATTGFSSSETTKKEDTTSTSDSNNDVVTVSEYLGNLFCDGCGKHCSLLSPRCGVGERQAQEATIEYEEIYAQPTTDLTETTSGTVTQESQDIAQSAASISTSDTLADKLTEGDLSAASGFFEVAPIMGFYIAGTYYVVRIIEAGNKRKEARDRTVG